MAYPLFTSKFVLNDVLYAKTADSLYKSLTVRGVFPDESLGAYRYAVEGTDREGNLKRVLLYTERELDKYYEKNVPFFRLGKSYVRDTSGLPHQFKYTVYQLHEFGGKKHALMKVYETSSGREHRLGIFGEGDFEVMVEL